MVKTIDKKFWEFLADVVDRSGRFRFDSLRGKYWRPRLMIKDDMSLLHRIRDTMKVGAINPASYGKGFYNVCFTLRDWLPHLIPYLHNKKEDALLMQKYFSLIKRGDEDEFMNNPNRKELDKIIFSFRKNQRYFYTHLKIKLPYTHK